VLYCISHAPEPLDDGATAAFKSFVRLGQATALTFRRSDGEIGPLPVRLSSNLVPAQPVSQPVPRPQQSSHTYRNMLSLE
jgi:hypothetical protein